MKRREKKANEIVCIYVRRTLIDTNRLFAITLREHIFLSLCSPCVRSTTHDE